MTQWTLNIPESTDRSVRSHLAAGGRQDNGDLARFVDRAVRQAIFRETLEAIWERNKDLSAEEAQRIADEAVAESRADRS